MQDDPLIPNRKWNNINIIAQTHEEDKLIGTRPIKRNKKKSPWSCAPGTQVDCSTFINQKGYFFFFFGAALADFFAGAFFLVAMADLLHSRLLKVIIDQNLKIYASFFLLQN